MPGPALPVLDAITLRVWAQAALRELALVRSEIDALNVYPVPDRDTGTNLYLTLESAVATLDDLPEDASSADVLGGLARGALLGARGNSGVILSQMLRGLANGVAGRPADATALAEALDQASDAAYAAVARPVEGTMLSVLRAAATAAGELEGDDVGVAAVVAAAANGAHQALARTPDQLDVLREAGVVDAGGQGICVLLDILEQVVSGLDMSPHAPEGGVPEDAAARCSTPAGAPAPAPAPVAWAGPTYEVMFLLDAPAEAIPALRHALTSLGESVTVAGDASTWSVHAHVDDVGPVLEAASSVGRPHDIRVVDLGQPCAGVDHGAP